MHQIALWALPRTTSYLLLQRYQIRPQNYILLEPILAMLAVIDSVLYCACFWSSDGIESAWLVSFMQSKVIFFVLCSKRRLLQIISGFFSAFQHYHLLKLIGWLQVAFTDCREHFFDYQNMILLKPNIVPVSYWPVIRTVMKN